MSDDITVPVHAPLTADEAQQVKRGLRFSRIWTCTNPVQGGDGAERPCGARLAVHAEHNHGDGDSNFVPHTDAKRLGQSKLLLSELTWEGMREERGWARQGEAIMCPACQAGLSVAEYKAMRRRQTIQEQIAALQAEL